MHYTKICSTFPSPLLELTAPTHTSPVIRLLFNPKSIVPADWEGRARLVQDFIFIAIVSLVCIYISYRDIYKPYYEHWASCPNAHKHTHFKRIDSNIYIYGERDFLSQ